MTPPASAPSTIRLLTISGSLRARSSNGELLAAVALLAPTDVVVKRFAGLAALPPFNPDLDGEGAVPPPPVAALREAVATASGLVVSSPEYAHGVPGALKNAFDWLVSDVAAYGKPVALLNASPLSRHAHPQLAETLRTMGMVIPDGADRVVPLSGRRLDARAIADDAPLAAEVRAALDALLALVRQGLTADGGG